MPATILSADSALSVFKSCIFVSAIFLISFFEIDAINSLPGVFDAFFNFKAFFMKKDTGCDLVSNEKLLSCILLSQLELACPAQVFGS